VFAQRADPSPDRGHMLADGQVEAFHERRIDLPTAGSQHLLDGLKRAEHDPGVARGPGAGGVRS